MPEQTNIKTIAVGCSSEIYASVADLELYFIRSAINSNMSEEEINILKQCADRMRAL